MTAAVVLQLVEEGLIELDEPVQTYVPTWLAGHPFESVITIRQLMNHILRTRRLEDASPHLIPLPEGATLEDFVLELTPLLAEAAG